jgi:hypothetical protein
VCAGAAFVLPACTSTYEVSVENATRGPIHAVLYQEQFMSDNVPFASAMIDPGESRTLGPAKIVWTDPVKLEVSEPGSMGTNVTRYRVTDNMRRLRVEGGQSTAWGVLTVTRADTAYALNPTLTEEELARHEKERAKEGGR